MPANTCKVIFLTSCGIFNLDSTLAVFPPACPLFSGSAQQLNDKRREKKNKTGFFSSLLHLRYYSSLNKQAAKNKNSQTARGTTLAFVFQTPACIRLPPLLSGFILSLIKNSLHLPNPPPLPPHQRVHTKKQVTAFTTEMTYSAVVFFFLLRVRVEPSTAQ